MLRRRTLLTRLRGATAGLVDDALEALLDAAQLLFGTRADRRQAAFAAGLIALAAKMAKADGVVMGSEVTAFRVLCDVPDGEARRAARLFDLAARSVAGFDLYARQLAKMFEGRPEALEDVLDGLFFIAKADGAVHERELAYLAEVAEVFGLGGPAFARIRARHVRPPEGDPFGILGLDPSASDREIKQRYRKLVIENHPDRLIARSLPAAAVKIANDRLAAINAAYEAVAAARGL